MLCGHVLVHHIPHFMWPCWRRWLRLISRRSRAPFKHHLAFGVCFTLAFAYIDHIVFLPFQHITHAHTHSSCRGTKKTQTFFSDICFANMVISKYCCWSCFFPLQSLSEPLRLLLCVMRTVWDRSEQDITVAFPRLAHTHAKQTSKFMDKREKNWLWFSYIPQASKLCVCVFCQWSNLRERSTVAFKIGR